MSSEPIKFGKHVQDWVTRLYDTCKELIDALAARVTKMENNGIVRDMRNPVTIKANDDLNNYIGDEKTGVYRCAYAEIAATVANCPGPYAFVLSVYCSSTVTFQYCDLYASGYKPIRFTRTYYSIDNVWSEWSCVTSYVAGYTGGNNVPDGRVIVSSSYNCVAPSSITTSELNMLEGVSSNIQDQIDDLRGNIGEVGQATQFGTANMVLVTNANKAATTSSISTTKLGYLTDVTSNIQAQINTKCAKNLGTASRVVVTDASGNITISTALTDPSKLQYLSGVTSDIQTQLNDKAPSSHTTNTTLHTNATERSTWNAKQDTTLATANAVVVTDSSKKITASTTITTTELGYLDGVTSNVQTQINAKAPSSHVGDSTHITSTERTNWNAASTHVSDTTKHITATERSTWNAKPKIWSSEFSLGGDKNGQVMTITHSLGVAPKMVYAHISNGGTTELNGGTSSSPLTLFVFATVPLVSGKLSTSQINILIPDVTTSSTTKVIVTALY